MRLLLALVAALTLAHLSAQGAGGQESVPNSDAREDASPRRGRQLLEEIEHQQRSAERGTTAEVESPAVESSVETANGQEAPAADPFALPTVELRPTEAPPIPGPVHDTVHDMVPEAVPGVTVDQTNHGNEAGLAEETADALSLAPRRDVPSEAARQSPPAADDPANIQHDSPLATMFGSLALVLALFFAAVWVMRRAMPASQRPLPSEAVEVLGRTSLPGRQQQMQLVRCGNKLLLLATSTSGVQPLTEITDADEVDRLVRLCRGQRYDVPASPWAKDHDDDRVLGSRRFDEQPRETAASALARRLGRPSRVEASDV